jgi:hypothetical protein
MSRWVVLKKPGLKSAVGGQEPPDGPLGRIAKYVPAEIVSAYTMLFGVMVSQVQGKLSEANQHWSALALIALFFLVTIIYVSKETDGAVRKVHLIVSPLAFLAWSYPISSALLGNWFYGLGAFALQAIVIALSLALYRAPA